MALTTAQDLATLHSWNFLTDYPRHRAAFLDVAKAAYRALRTFSGAPPSGPIDLEAPLAAALQVTHVFKTLCAAKPHARPSLYPVFASALARYILDREWSEVTSP
jgi:hypothetical protein